jgi:hypothetical protein
MKLWGGGFMSLRLSGGGPVPFEEKKEVPEIESSCEGLSEVIVTTVRLEKRSTAGVGSPFSLVFPTE